MVYQGVFENLCRLKPALLGIGSAALASPRWASMLVINHMRNILLVAIAAVFCGCQSPPKPGLSLKDAHLAEGPVIIQRGEHFYLRYRRALEGNQFPLRAALVVKRADGAAYYYFTGQISHPEWGNLVERPLAFDGLEELARQGRIYWLDPDGTKHTIPLQTPPTP